MLTAACLVQQPWIEPTKQQGVPTPRPALPPCRLAALAQVKNSTTRNLHRLASAIRFIQLLFERLVSASKQGGDSAAAAATLTLREAASSAYEEALAPIHTTIVRVRLPELLLRGPRREQCTLAWAGQGSTSLHGSL